MHLHNIKANLKQFYEAAIFGFLILISLTLVFQPLAIKHKIADFIGFPILAISQNATLWLSDVHRLGDENRALKQTVAALTVENARLQNLRNENNHWGKVYNFLTDFQYPTTVARVIGFDSERSEKTITVNKGYLSGVDKNWAVLTPQGIIGKTLMVEAHHSVVQLLQDRNCKVSVINTRSREIGILTWTPEDQFHLIYIPPKADMAEGDTIITSGYGGIFPRNIPVGTIAKTHFNQQRQQLEASVELSAALNQLEDVIIVSADQQVAAPVHIEAETPPKQSLALPRQVPKTAPPSSIQNQIQSIDRSADIPDTTEFPSLELRQRTDE